MKKEDMVFHDEGGRPYVLVTEGDGTEHVQYLDVDSLSPLEYLEALPSYETRLVTCDVVGRTFQHRWMARDIPGRGRRFTNLDYGTEVFPRAEGGNPLTVTFIKELPEGEKKT